MKTSGTFSKSLAGLFLSMLIAAPLARASIIPESPPSIWNPESMGVSSSAEYFNSTANYDETRGSYTKLANSNSFTNFETRTRGRYAFSNSVSAFTGFGFAQSQATDISTNKTNTNVTDVFLGADFQLLRRWWRVIPEFEFSYPTDAATKNQTVPLTNEGVWYARAGVFMFKPYKYFRFESYLGFHYPGEGLAKRFIYTLLAETAFASGFSLGGGIDGTESLLADEKSSADRLTPQVFADAGSHRFWAYNPSLIEARVWLGFRADKAFTFRLGYAKTLNGMRSAEGQSLLLSLAYNSPGDKMEGKRLRDILQKRADENFKTEPEKTDPEIFQQPDSEPLTPKIKKKETLDDTEKLLENRAQ